MKTRDLGSLVAMPDVLDDVVVVELFCGAGGLTHGLELEAMTVVAGIDLDERCRYPYEHNNRARFIHADVSQLSSAEVEKLYPAGAIKILAGCAPCQHFSRLPNIKSARKDWRLLDDFARIASDIRPTVVTMENVPSLQSHTVFEEFVTKLKSAGYSVKWQVINCQDYDVPQTRRRLVLFASLLGEISPIPPTVTLDQRRKVADVIGTLPSISAGAAHDDDPIHRASALSQLNLERIRHTPEGGGWQDWPEELRADCHKKDSGQSYNDVYGRMRWDAAAPTMTTQCRGYGNGRFGHPSQDRAISLREAALFQTFPPAYKFVADGETVQPGVVARHIGNAVPVNLGRMIAATMRNHLTNYYAERWRLSLPNTDDYKLTIDLNVLNHLGIHLYSNVPAVLSEAVANAYDADASMVQVQIDKSSDVITIVDDGSGMDRDDANRRFLRVGYQKRKEEPAVTPGGRTPMGRKGIGKLALFAIAKIIEVRSAKIMPDGTLSKCGFIMYVDAIRSHVEQGNPNYNPTPIPDSDNFVQMGTEITLRQIKMRLNATENYLRKRLARRFTVIGASSGFEVKINGESVGVADRDYFSKLQYVWYFGDDSKHYAEQSTNASQKQMINDLVNAEKNYRVSGWLGTVKSQNQIEEGTNTIVVIARGRLVHEDLLKDLKEAGVFATYLMGEVRADFLDSNDAEDIATSDRQSLKEDDPRYEALKTFVDTTLKTVKNNWATFKRLEGVKEASENPGMREWLDSLTGDNRKYAEQLLGTVNSLPTVEAETKRELYKYSILAFETLATRRNLSAIDSVTPENIELLQQLVSSLDSLESAHYYDIVRNRVSVLKKFQELVPTSKERAIQSFIFEHLWLLNPSWERASTDARIEESVMQEFKGVDAGLTKDEIDGRLDIRYRTYVDKHIIVELKKYDRKINAMQLVGQVSKYKTTLEKCLLTKYNKKSPQIEIICLLGTPPTPFEQDEDNRKLLAVYAARYILYDELIDQTRQSYADYLEAEQRVARIQQIVDKIGAAGDNGGSNDSRTALTADGQGEGQEHEHRSADAVGAT